MNKESKKSEDFTRISSTAMYCARVKAEYTSLPYAKKIYDLASELSISNLPSLEYDMEDTQFRANLSILEGRYLAINDLISRLDGFSILELSSGLSSRSLQFSDRFYIETDLPQMSLLKKNIIQEIIKKPVKNVLSLNPLNQQDIMSFGENFYKDQKNPVAVVNEGLLMYLSINEQEILSQNIALFLERYSPEGCWITTDFSSRHKVKDDKTTKLLMDKIERETRRDFNRFNDDLSVKEFLSEKGMQGIAFSNIHIIDRLSCLDNLKITKENALKVSEFYRAWRIDLNEKNKY